MSETCIICLENIKDIESVYPCNCTMHKHAECLILWINQNGFSCEICKQDYKQPFTRNEISDEIYKNNIEAQRIEDDEEYDDDDDDDDDNDEELLEYFYYYYCMVCSNIANLIIQQRIYYNCSSIQNYKYVYLFKNNILV